MTFEEEFEKNNIINTLAKYEMYYQVSLGSLISDSKTSNIDPTIQLQYALGSIYDMISQIIKLENAEEIFDKELQKQSAMDALQDFVNANMQIVKDGSIKIEPIVNAINDGVFFHKSMIEICDENLDAQIKKWSNIIDDETAKKIQASIKEMIS